MLLPRNFLRTKGDIQHHTLRLISRHHLKHQPLPPLLTCRFQPQLSDPSSGAIKRDIKEKPAYLMFVLLEPDPDLEVRAADRRTQVALVRVDEVMLCAVAVQTTELFPDDAADLSYGWRGDSVEAEVFG